MPSQSGSASSEMGLPLISHRALLSTNINGCRLQLFVLETLDDSTFNIDAVEVGCGLLQSHVSSLRE